MILHNIIEKLFSRNKKELLVTTSKSILHVTLATGELREVHTGAGLYYGITFNPKNKCYYIMARNNADPFDYLSKEERSKEQSKILVFNKSLELIDEFYPPHPITDFHQATIHDDNLWITCTILNAIYIYDFNSWKIWYPLECEGKVDEDINHFNSISILDNKIHIVAHNFGKSEVLIFELDSRLLVDRKLLGNCAHNVWYGENGELWVCDSLNGKLINDKGREVELEGFTRGVAFINQLIIVGSSGISKRDNRIKVDSKVFILNKDFLCTSEIEIKGYGQILDILSIE